MFLYFSLILTVVHPHSVGVVSTYFCIQLCLSVQIWFLVNPKYIYFFLKHSHVCFAGYLMQFMLSQDVILTYLASFFFYVSLTVRLGIFPINDHLDGLFFFSIYLFILSTLHVSSTWCLSSGEVNCAIHHLVWFTLEISERSRITDVLIKFVKCCTLCNTTKPVCLRPMYQAVTYMGKQIIHSANYCISRGLRKYICLFNRSE
jgi:hypothetical protein